jgi:hypothetical protein
VKRLALFGTLAALVMLIASPAYATGVRSGFSTTDLNLIPITDTNEEGVAEWDVTVRYNESLPRGRRLNSRVFVALFDDFEFGMQWGLNRTGGPVAFGAKWKILDEYENNGFPVSAAVGFDGATGNYQRTGADPTYYIVLGKHDVRFITWTDWYIGVANNPTNFDNEDNSLFGGVKAWINDDWQLDLDYYGYNDNSDFLAAVGLDHHVANHIVVAARVEYDSVAEDSVFVAEIATSADLRDLTAEVSDPE